jgi:hypothetical protein
MFPIGHVPTQIYVNKTYIPHYNLAIIYIYFTTSCMHQNASTEYKSATNKAK